MTDDPIRPFNYRRLFWKWHLYAGLFGAPLLMLIAVTGAILVFSPEIDRWLRPDLWRIQAPPPGSASAMGQGDQKLIDMIRARFPDSRIIIYRQNHEADEACQVLMLTPGIEGLHDVWVNPYTAELVGDRHRESAFVRIVEQLHRRLLTGEIGSSIIELITGWGIVLILTGLYMWWPGTLRQLRVALTVPLRASAYRINWRLHNTVGGWVAALLLLLALTGMVFSTFTGGMYQKLLVSTGGNANPLLQPPKSRFNEDAKPIAIDQLLEQVRAETPAGTKFNVQFPRDREGCFTITPLRGDRPLWEGAAELRVWCFDQYSGNLLAAASWDDFHPLVRFRLLCMMIHFGSIFGLPTKILAVAACLGVPVLGVTGYLIWWWKRQRRPAGSTEPEESAPGAEVSTAPLSIWAVATILLVCVIFPTVGASFLVLAAYEKSRALWQRRISRA